MELTAIQTRFFPKSDNADTLPPRPSSGLHSDNGTSTTLATLISEQDTLRTRTGTKPGPPRLIRTPDAALGILKSQPQQEDLLRVLRWLDRGSDIVTSSSISTSTSTSTSTIKVDLNSASTSTSAPASASINDIDDNNNDDDDNRNRNSDSSNQPSSDDTTNGFNIHYPDPRTAPFIHVLVHEIIPTYWPAVNADAGGDGDRDGNGEVRALLVRTLRSVPGLGALVARMKALLGGGGVKGAGLLEVQVLMQVLEGVLQGDGVVGGIWRGGWMGERLLMMKKEEEEEKKKKKKKRYEGLLLWKEGLGLLAGGRVLSVAGEAERVLAEKEGEGVKVWSWVAEGEKYVSWLGRNVWSMLGHTVGARGEEEEEEVAEERRAAGQVLAKGLKLGSVDAMVQAVFAHVLAGHEGSVLESMRLLDYLTVHEQKTVLYALIRTLEKRYLTSNGGREDERNVLSLGSVAGLLSAVTADAPVRKDTMIEWLTGLSAEATRQSHLTHRAVVLALSTKVVSVKTALVKALELFADKLFIKHTPVFQQEINAQVVLLLVGYVHRVEKAELEKISKSSLYLNAISNHLASTSPRSRFLGMVVGTAVSDLVDSKDKRMNFSSEDMEGSDGRWYRGLTDVKDSIRPIKDLLSKSGLKQPPTPRKESPMRSVTVNKPKPSSSTKAGTKIISIEELADDSAEDDDLPTYAKPHSDPEDSGDDPELVQRSKPTAPVYIRDLLAGLRNLDDYERHRLALSTAPSLIRRKAAFGTEVTDNIEDLASILVGLNDRYEMESFQRHRLQGMIALLVADPERMGPWFARTFYDGEYSMSQRASVLTTLGLGAREIAGLSKEDDAMTGSSGASSEPQFPSKRLPEKLHNHYASLPTSSKPKPRVSVPSTPIDTLSSNLSKTMLQPLAARAADELSGPSALKVRTFSSRLAVQSRTAPPTANPLAKILATAFFFPLVGRWSIHLRTHSDSTTTTTITSPFLLSHLLRTLALIVHAAGRTSPDVREVTAEFWALVLSARAKATELPVLEAVLFALLTLLEVNLARGDEGRRVAEEHARELLETQAWVEGLFERIGSGKSGEDEKVRMLAAGVLVRCREVVERYQRLLMGDLVDYM